MRENTSEGINENDKRAKKSDAMSFTAFIILAFVLTFYKYKKGIPFGDIPALLFIYVAVEEWLRYNKYKEKGTFSLAVISTVVCIISLVWYIYQTF